MGMTQSELADRAGLSQNCIWYYETGSRRPNSDKVKQLADALDITCDKLLGRGRMRITDLRLRKIAEELAIMPYSEHQSIIQQMAIALEFMQWRRRVSAGRASYALQENAFRERRLWMN